MWPRLSTCGRIKAGATGETSIGLVAGPLSCKNAAATMPVPALAWRLIAPPMSNGGLLGRGASPRSRQCAAPHLSLAISPPISGPAHPRNRRRQVAGRRGRARQSRRPITRQSEAGSGAFPLSLRSYIARRGLLQTKRNLVRDLVVCSV